MNMSLLEVAMCEKSRSSHFLSQMGWGSKKFENCVEVKTLGLRVYRFVGAGTFAGSVSTLLNDMSQFYYRFIYPSIMPWNNFGDISLS